MRQGRREVQIWEGFESQVKNLGCVGEGGWESYKLGLGFFGVMVG